MQKRQRKTSNDGNKRRRLLFGLGFLGAVGITGAVVPLCSSCGSMSKYGYSYWDQNNNNGQNTDNQQPTTQTQSQSEQTFTENKDRIDRQTLAQDRTEMEVNIDAYWKDKHSYFEESQSQYDDVMSDLDKITSDSNKELAEGTGNENDQKASLAALTYLGLGDMFKQAVPFLTMIYVPYRVYQYYTNMDIGYVNQNTTDFATIYKNLQSQEQKTGFITDMKYIYLVTHDDNKYGKLVKEAITRLAVFLVYLDNEIKDTEYNTKEEINEYVLWASTTNQIIKWREDVSTYFNNAVTYDGWTITTDGTIDGTIITIPPPKDDNQNQSA